MNVLIPRISTLTALLASVVFYSVASAAEPGDKGVAKEPATIEKLVANQPEQSAAPGRPAGSDQPATINFSDYVKEGAACGVPNLETSSK